MFILDKNASTYEYAYQIVEFINLYSYQVGIPSFEF